VVRCSISGASVLHYGLEIMHERAKVLGGELHVEPVIPHGTSVVLRFNSLKKTVA